jgi:hypothetical protein
MVSLLKLAIIWRRSNNSLSWGATVPDFKLYYRHIVLKQNGTGKKKEY